MPDLGKYAFDVTLAYAVSMALLVGIVALSVWQSRRTAKTLKQMEQDED